MAARFPALSAQRSLIGIGDKRQQQRHDDCRRPAPSLDDTTTAMMPGDHTSCQARKGGDRCVCFAYWGLVFVDAWRLSQPSFLSSGIVRWQVLTDSSSSRHHQNNFLGDWLTMIRTQQLSTSFLFDNE
jgi:hypothetical protein